MPYGVGFRSTLDRATILGKAKDHLGRSQPFLRRSAGHTAFPMGFGMALQRYLATVIHNPSEPFQT